MQYIEAKEKNIAVLVEQRLSFLGATPKLSGYDSLKKNCYNYFQTALRNGMCDAFLVREDGALIGIGVIFYYLSVPSLENPTGKNAYITNLYVAKEYRRQGIATQMVKKLVKIAQNKGYCQIMLNASEMGKTIVSKAWISKNRSCYDL